MPQTWHNPGGCESSGVDWVGAEAHAGLERPDPAPAPVRQDKFAPGGTDVDVLGVGTGLYLVQRGRMGDGSGLEGGGMTVHAKSLPPLLDLAGLHGMLRFVPAK